MNNNLKEQLFPTGMPSPEEFIRVVAAYVREQTGMDEAMEADSVPQNRMHSVDI